MAMTKKKKKTVCRWHVRSVVRNKLIAVERGDNLETVYVFEGEGNKPKALACFIANALNKRAGV